MSLDKERWTEDGKVLSLTQDAWIPKYNKAGRIMAAMPDYYLAAKSDDEALGNVQEDFNSWVMTGTRIIYNLENLEGRIIHHYGSSVVEPAEREVFIPDYSNGILLGNALDTEQGLSFLQGLFLTEDDKETIMEIFEKLGGKKRDEIKIWAPAQDSRKSNPLRAASLSYSGGCFRVYVSNNLNLGGRSRAVAASEASLEARSAPGAKNSGLPFNMESSVDKKGKSACFSNMQAIGNFNKYTAMFCYYGRRYVLSSIFDIGEVPGIDSRIANILSKGDSTEEKLQAVGSFLHPVYAHLALYAGGKLLDDIEFFEDTEVKK